MLNTWISGCNINIQKNIQSRSCSNNDFLSNIWLGTRSDSINIISPKKYIFKLELQFGHLLEVLKSKFKKEILDLQFGQ